ncbi:thioredoxin family protein [Aurantiacibacter rhizosphaerae]|nr:thioredoxin family protein [Aurantiacibacter rhizosphaerae]
MTLRRVLGAAIGLAMLSACATTTAPQSHAPDAVPHAEGAIYDPSIDASAAVDAALAQAAADDKRVLLVMGANWCQDSRALASYLMEPALAAELDANFETVFVNVGLPQTGDGYNLDIAERFGVSPEGTPNVLLLNSEGELLNSQDNAVSWRNSASRTSADVLEVLQGWSAK